ncbi:MAG: hypothetical protein IJB10_04370 [Clostridia bacterium]|nr:hypothetical protein [Clostridia bacterium]
MAVDFWGNEINKDNKENQSPEKQKKDKVGTICLIIIGAIMAIWGFVSIFSSTEANLEVTGTSMSVEYNEYLEEYTAVVKGRLTNKSSKKYAYVQVQFSLYDAAGNNLGTAFANMNELAGGDTWVFEAHLFYSNSRPVSYKLSDVSGW